MTGLEPRSQTGSRIMERLERKKRDGTFTRIISSICTLQFCIYITNMPSFPGFTRPCFPTSSGRLNENLVSPSSRTEINRHLCPRRITRDRLIVALRVMTRICSLRKWLRPKIVTRIMSPRQYDDFGNINQNPHNFISVLRTAARYTHNQYLEQWTA